MSRRQKIEHLFEIRKAANNWFDHEDNVLQYN